jgi:parallel beta-helix repeat protein
MSKRALILIAIFVLFIVQFTYAQSYTDILITAAKSMIDSNASLVVLDVRNQSEYDAGHIRNAKLIPLYELQQRLGELNKTDEILVYCKAGGRSTQASQILDSNGFLHIYNMLGGFDAWNKTGYPYYVRYPSIQEAVNSASEGNSILISSGLYYEHVLVNKSVSIIGENENKTIIDGYGNGTILQIEANNVSISHLTLQFSGCACQGFCGIYEGSPYQNLNITDNNLESNGYGIELNWAQGAILTRNTIGNSSYAIVANNCSNISIQTNLITSNSDGIDLVNSTNIDILGNTIHYNAYGLYMAGSNNNSVCDNLFDSNQVYGILNGGQSANNSIFHNNFVSNIYDASISDSGNFWDNGYPSGGNYWSKYIDFDLFEGVSQNETGSDGIWDHPYNLTGGIDHYPFKGPFNNYLAGTWNQTEYDVDVVSNSTVSNFNFSSSANTSSVRFDVKGANSGGSFCRVTVPKSIMPTESPEQWIITADGNPIQQRNVVEDDHCVYIYFNYTNNVNTVQILSTYTVSEFPTFLVTPLFMLSTLSAVFLYRKRCSKQSADLRERSFSSTSSCDPSPRAVPKCQVDSVSLVRTNARTFRK